MIEEEKEEALKEEAADAIKEEDTEKELEEVLAEDTAEETAEERTYTIPLGKALIKPPKKRAPRAMRMIRAFITKHMKLTATAEEGEEEKELPSLVISEEVNEKVWGRGIEKTPRKIRVRAAKDKDGNVTVYLAE